MAENDVIAGNDGWLFLAGGANNPLRFYTDPNFFGEAERQGWLELLANRYDQFASRRIAYAHIAPPEKLTIYPEFFPDSLSSYEACPSIALPGAIAANSRRKDLQKVYVDLLPNLAIAKDDGQLLYWKTDTHWTFFGAWQAYLSLCARLCLEPDRQIAFRGFNYGEMVLDLGGKFHPPITEVYKTQHIEKKARRINANSLVSYKEQRQLESVAGLHGGSSVVFFNDSPEADPRRMIIFGDSYAEYRPILLTGLFAETVRELHFVWSARIDWNYIDRVKPDIVVTELAERFMNYVPTDDLDLDVFPQERIAAYEAANP